MWKSNGYVFDTITELKESLVRLIGIKSVKCLCGNNIIWKIRKGKYIHNGAWIERTDIVCLHCHTRYKIKDFLDELKKLNLIDEKNIYDNSRKQKNKQTEDNKT